MLLSLKPDEARIKFKLKGRQVEISKQNNTALKAGGGRRLCETDMRTRMEYSEVRQNEMEPNMKPAEQET